MEAPIDINIFLPHRPPMLMVDLILAIDDERVDTIFKINDDNIFLQNGVFTESGLIENAAQTCSSIVAKSYYVDENNESKEGVRVMGFISALKVMKIHALPRSGETISTKALLVSKFLTDEYTLCTMACTTYHESHLLMEGEINLFISEIPEPASQSNAI
ncbi:MAG TPA: ABC transporter permease [Flavobacterium sp.]|jgi:predicted hotdog family 3-hydroxylacyl-ACP dehydratase